MGGEEYDNTFSLALTSVADMGLARDLLAIAKGLYRLKLGERIMLLDGMLSGGLDGQDLHYLFSYLRAALVSISGDPLSALHQPLHREYKRPKAFPLHADLYVPRILFNVFDDVPRDDSGATTFLSAAVFLRMLPGVKAIDGAARKRIRAILTGTHREDRYEEFYRLLHDKENAWDQELGEKMAARQLTVKLYSGQGYLIDDRAWLHGREAPSGGVSRRRLHRLIFNNRDKSGRKQPGPNRG
jgi:hypothetical protein